MRDAHVRDIGHAAIRVSSFRGVKLVPLSDKVRERKMKISSASPLRGGCNGGELGGEPDLMAGRAQRF